MYKIRYYVGRCLVTYTADNEKQKDIFIGYLNLLGLRLHSISCQLVLT